MASVLACDSVAARVRRSGPVRFPSSALSRSTFRPRRRCRWRRRQDRLLRTGRGKAEPSLPPPAGTSKASRRDRRRRLTTFRRCGDSGQATAISAAQEGGGVSGNRRAATLPVSFFRRPSEVVARELLGTTLVSLSRRPPTVGRIVETEAYLGYRDPASHGYRHRRNAGNGALFGPPGTWYVYRSYGIHWCANLVCGVEGEAARSCCARCRAAGGHETDARSPGHSERQTSLFGSWEALSGARDDEGGDGRGADEGIPTDGAGRKKRGASAFAVTPRIGITRAADWPLRFLLVESPWVSRGLGRLGRPSVEAQ